MHPMIDIQNVSKIYHPGENEIRALDNVSIQIQTGEFIAIVGSSGSGKSTLMNILGCLDTPSKGKYLLDGADVSALGDAQLSRIRNRKIGFIFQGFNLIPTLTAIENVELPLSYRGVPRAKRRQLAREALDAVLLSNRMNHKPSQMSGGQQQRVAIARAIASAPSLVLADEPTGNLDSRSGAEIMRVLHTLHDSGKTIILITHDDKVALSAQRVLHISDGELVS